MFVGVFGIFFVAFVALAVVLVVLAYQAAQKRRAEFAAVAAARGWSYAAEDQRLVGRFQGSPFGTGDSRRATNVLYGTHAERPMVAFDYQYSTTSGTGEDRSTSTHTFSVVCLSMGVTMPTLSVSPEGVFGRFFGRLTGSDVQIGPEEFDHAFTVHAADRAFAADVLSPSMTTMLLQHPDLAWRMELDSLLVFRSGSHSLPEIDAKLAVMDQIIDLVPEVVWRRLRGQV